MLLRVMLKGMDVPAIEVNGLTKAYKEQVAVKNATFSVPLGTVCGFVGPNGSGKTTTIRMLLSLISPTEGSAKVLGTSIEHPEDYLSSVGAMIEGPAFYPALSGEENLNVLATIGGFPLSRVSELLELVGLADRADSKFKTYSLGMKQRLGIAAALLPSPRLLILDEPTNGLDPAGIHEMRLLLLKLAKEGTTVFVSSHLLSELEVIAEYLVMLREGSVIFAGPIHELLAAQQPSVVLVPEKLSDLAALVTLVIDHGLPATVVDDTVRVVGSQSDAPVLNRLAFAAGITLVELRCEVPSLEETFFDMTGGY